MKLAKQLYIIITMLNSAHMLYSANPLELLTAIHKEETKKFNRNMKAMMTPLIRAMYVGDRKKFDYIVPSDNTASKAGFAGITPFHFLVNQIIESKTSEPRNHAFDLHVAESLMQHGGDPRKLNDFGLSPLDLITQHIAAGHEFPADIHQLLLGAPQADPQ
jgi:hypothetical protein